MTSHYTQGSMTYHYYMMLEVCRDGLGTLFLLGSRSQSHGHGSRLVCEAMSRENWYLV